MFASLILVFAVFAAICGLGALIDRSEEFPGKPIKVVTYDSYRKYDSVYEN